MELTVVIPCLDEAETVATCVSKPVRFIEENGMDGEAPVADNGSTDGSRRPGGLHRGARLRECRNCWYSRSARKSACFEH